MTVEAVLRPSSQDGAGVGVCENSSKLQGGRGKSGAHENRNYLASNRGVGPFGHHSEVKTTCPQERSHSPRPATHDPFASSPLSSLKKRRGWA